MSSGQECGEKINPKHTIKILITSDIHLGYNFNRKGGQESDDTFITFEEILQYANEYEIDFILLGGDLFHDAKPTQSAILKCINLLRKYCLDDRAVTLGFLSDPEVIFQYYARKMINYEDPNVNVGMPIFSINGNHDDPCFGAVGSMDLLSISGIVNYFVKSTDLTHVGLLSINGKLFKLKKLKLKTVRPFVFDNLILDDNFIQNDHDLSLAESVFNFVDNHIENKVIPKAVEQLSGHPKQPVVPLIRLRIFHTKDEEVFDTNKLAQKYFEEVANPLEMVVFRKKRSPGTRSSSRFDDISDDLQNMADIFAHTEDQEWKETVQGGLKRFFNKEENEKLLTVLTVDSLNEALTQFISKGDGDAFKNLLSHQMKEIVSHLEASEATATDESIKEEIKSFHNKRKEKAQEEGIETQTLFTTRPVKPSNNDEVINVDSRSSSEDEAEKSDKVPPKYGRGGGTGIAARGRGARNKSKETDKSCVGIATKRSSTTIKKQTKTQDQTLSGFVIREINRSKPVVIISDSESKKVERSPKKLEIGKWEFERMLREMREGMRKDIGEDIKKLGKEMEEGREEMTCQLNELRDSWGRERAELLEKIEGLERKVERLEVKEKEREGAGGREEGRKEMERKMREVVIRVDKREREERRKNLIVKGVKVEGREIGKVIEELMSSIDVKEKVEVRTVGGVDKEGRSMMLVKMEGMEGKKKVMMAKRKLKGRCERIEDDMTVEERRARWKIEREGERERREGKRVQIGYMRMWVNDRMRRWDEIEEKWIEEQGNE